MIGLVLALFACAPEGGPPSCGAAEGLVAATTDFSVGVLSTVDRSGALSDGIASVGGDPLVRVTGGAVYVANRSSGDTLRRHEPGELCRPTWEIALTPGSNVHDVLEVEGELWVARYDDPRLGIVDPVDGAPIALVDLAELDPDGVPEAHDLVLHDGKVLVAAQVFDRTDPTGWRSVAGRIAEIDPGSRAITRTWETGPSPRLPDPVEGGPLLVLTGTYGSPDGALDRFDPADGSFARILDEVELGRDLEGLAAFEGRIVLTGSDFDLGGGAASCVDLASGEVTGSHAVDGWLVDVVAGDAAAWLGLRRGWGDGDRTGLLALDPVGCELVATAETAFEPYSLAWQGG